MNNMRKIVAAVADHCEVPYSRIVAKKNERSSLDRSRRVTEARAVSIYIIRESIRASYPEIGHFFGMDHTSVMYAHKRIAANFPERCDALADRFLFPANTARCGNA